MKNILLVFVIFAMQIFIACNPEKDGPKPYSYIIEGPQDLYPAFSPDGNKIAYFHNAWNSPNPPDGYPSGLYIINKDGSDRRLVLEASFINAPSWSPDGTLLVFSNDGTIQKCKIDGSELTTFTGLDHLENSVFYFPSWSFSDNSITFDKPFLPDWGFYSTSFDFSNVNRTFNNEILGRDPEINREGTKVVYFTGKGGGGNGINITEIFLFDKVKESSEQVTFNGRDNRSPTWSPNGQQIVWSSSHRLSIMNADGSNQRRIAFGNSPSWSVQEKIVFSHANSDYSREVLYTIDTDGKNKIQITF